jgi:phosphatidylglycerophosphate synthase
MTAFWCIIFHDFLDHLDGIVAKVQRVTYPNHDDPLLGGFLDAFCDKIVNVLSLWTILQTSDFSAATGSELFMMLLVCYSVMAYEIVIGIVRVEDFFKATYYK